MPLQTVAHDNSEVIYQALHDDGAVVVRDLFATNAIERIADDVGQALDPLPWCNSEEEGYGREFFGHKTKRLHGVLQYSEPRWR